MFANACPIGIVTISSAAIPMAISKLGIGQLDTVAIIASNIPEMRRPSRPSPRKCVTAGCLYVRNSAWDRVIDTNLKVRR